jgi:hypothetical protein
MRQKSIADNAMSLGEEVVVLQITVLKLLGALAIAQLFHPEAVCLCNSSSRGFIDSNCRAACALSTCAAKTATPAALL